MHFQHGRLETNIVPVMLIGDFSDWDFSDWCRTVFQQAIFYENLPYIVVDEQKVCFFSKQKLKYTAAVNVIK